MVEPERGAAVALGRSGTLGHRPGVDVGLPWRHGVVHPVDAARAVEIRRAFGALVVEHAMRVQRVRTRGVVAQHDAYRVADLGAEQRTEDAQVLPRLAAGLERAEAGVRVLRSEEHT